MPVVNEAVAPHPAALLAVPSIVTPRLDLVSMSAGFLRASLEGRLADAEADLGAALPLTWPHPWRRFVEIRLADLETNPAARPWLMRAIVRRELAGLPVELYLFGSRATGTARVSSDLDIGVLPTGPVPDAPIAVNRFLVPRGLQ